MLDTPVASAIDSHDSPIERLAMEHQVLERFALGLPLREILHTLVLGLESMVPGARAAVHGIDAEGRVECLVAPNLPDVWLTALTPRIAAAIDAPLPDTLRPDSPLASFDLAADPAWHALHALAAAHRLRACWSVPVTDTARRVCGMLTLFPDAPRAPTPAERELLAFGARIAAISIDRDRARSEIDSGREQLQTILDAIPISIGYVDAEHRMRFVNRQFERSHSIAHGRAIGMPVVDILGPDGSSRRWHEMRKVIQGEEARFEIQMRDCRGGIRHLDVHYLPHHDHDGRVLGRFVIEYDITSRKEHDQLLEFLATHDQLTGLPNRALFSLNLDGALARAARDGQKIAVLFVDLDRFKYINDTLGHAVGDKVLQSVSGRLLHAVRSADTVARLGGDEFVLLIEQLNDARDAAVLAQKLIESLAKVFVIDQRELYVTASIGIAVSPEDGADAAMLLRNADLAMYRAKHEGKNRLAFFSPEVDQASIDRLTLEGALRRAVEKSELVLHFQPILNLATGEIDGVEALLRWNHPQQGLLSPLRFIPLAEETGLIGAIGEWVIANACLQCAELRTRTGQPLRIALNLSARQLRDPGLATRIREIVALAGLDARRLTFEITETAIMENAEAATRTLTHLRQHGARISLDDFGTGYSSLSLLRRFPIDIIKIDQSFVRDLETDSHDASIVRTVIAMGSSLGMDTVAEGVETPGQLAFLRAEGCVAVQGYLLSRPLGIDALKHFLEAGRAIPLRRAR